MNNTKFAEYLSIFLESKKQCPQVSIALVESNTYVTETLLPELQRLLKEPSSLNVQTRYGHPEMIAYKDNSAWIFIHTSPYCRERIQGLAANLAIAEGELSNLLRETAIMRVWPQKGMYVNTHGVEVKEIVSKVSGTLYDF
jgi:hypothetical protein